VSAQPTGVELNGTAAQGAASRGDGTQTGSAEAESGWFAGILNRIASETVLAEGATAQQVSVTEILSQDIDGGQAEQMAALQQLSGQAGDAPVKLVVDVPVVESLQTLEALQEAATETSPTEPGSVASINVVQIADETDASLPEEVAAAVAHPVVAARLQRGQSTDEAELGQLQESSQNEMAAAPARVDSTAAARDGGATALQSARVDLPAAVQPQIAGAANAERVIAEQPTTPRPVVVVNPAAVASGKAVQEPVISQAESGNAVAESAVESEPPVVIRQRIAVPGQNVPTVTRGEKIQLAAANRAVLNGAHRAGESRVTVAQTTMSDAIIAPAAGELRPLAVGESGLSLEMRSVLTGGTQTQSSESSGRDAMIRNQLTAQLGWMRDGGINRATLQLHPAELGAVTIQLDSSSEGLSVNILAAQPATRESIEQTLHRLRDQLEAQGFNGVNIDLGTNDEFAEAKNNNKELNRSEGNVASNELPEPEPITVRVRTGDSLVDLFA